MFISQLVTALGRTSPAFSPKGKTGLQNAGDVGDTHLRVVSLPQGREEIEGLADILDHAIARLADISSAGVETQARAERSQKALTEVMDQLATSGIPQLVGVIGQLAVVSERGAAAQVKSERNEEGLIQAIGHLTEIINTGQIERSRFERSRGRENPDPMSARNNLAVTYLQAGRVAEAIPLLEQTLASRERGLGSDHPDTLQSRNNLAVAYQRAGRAAEAIPLHRATLLASERVLGADHPDTLSSRNNLAIAYRDAGRNDEAIPLLQSTVADSERVLGPDHPDTLQSRNALAAARQAAGQGEAAPRVPARSAPVARRGR
jgi:tetratricopeptide (TPR) repeat protein